MYAWDACERNNSLLILWLSVHYFDDDDVWQKIEKNSTLTFYAFFLIVRRILLMKGAITILIPAINLIKKPTTSSSPEFKGFYLDAFCP